MIEHKFSRDKLHNYRCWYKFFIAYHIVLFLGSLMNINEFYIDA